MTDWVREFQESGLIAFVYGADAIPDSYCSPSTVPATDKITVDSNFDPSSANSQCLVPSTSSSTDPSQSSTRGPASREYSLVSIQDPTESVINSKREAAKRAKSYRDRKKSQIGELESTLEKLAEDNRILSEQNRRLESENSTLRDLIIRLSSQSEELSQRSGQY
ncbi:uncharacterized protein I206_106455 [Kwoniella pini CBS 10737]|uniref:BZIP domain-containing protein n=1 Tax=Kwoniella pini CBS 10737 TaxID=1296096 RepID=A0A1B9HUD0_9TREE|nr:uncharacterized protein I206_07259 [Kwoniella pini CBS 10737]OCF46872.1 hypothetical protein I206_07259 [Kwoniella pini CBS 10737]